MRICVLCSAFVSECVRAPVRLNVCVRVCVHVCACSLCVRVSMCASMRMCIRIYYVCSSMSLVIHIVDPTDVNQYAVQRCVTAANHSCSSK